MTQLPVKFSRQAERDIDDVFGYISVQSGGTLNANRLLDRLIQKCEDIAIFPYSGIDCGDLKRNLRMTLFEKSYRVFYTVDKHQILITNIVHARRLYKDLIQ